MSVEHQNRNTAVERWKILKRAILAANRRSQEEPVQATRASVRSFASFELFSITDIAIGELVLCGCSQGEVWKRYSYKIGTATCGEPSDRGTDAANSGEERTEILHDKPGCDVVSVIVSHLSPKTSLEAMMGFNNTGNVCVWPSEEVLAHYCLENRELFCGRSVCELGGGMTCLAGLMLARTGLPARVKLTDGNTGSVENVKRILDANEGALNGVEVSAEVLLWDEAFLNSERSKFDFVICADCVFFVDLHQTLCRVMHKLLSPGGSALLFNPTRTGTLDQFVRAAEKLFAVRRCERYSELVWGKHCTALATDRYKSDLHYPVLLELKPLTTAD